MVLHEARILNILETRRFFRPCGILAAGIVTSMMFFPFEFKALPPGMNSKKMLAVVGLVFLFFGMVKKRELKIDRDFLYVSLLAILVSFCGLFSVTFNETSDYAYANYISSAWVWMGAAYAAYSMMRLVHKEVNCVVLINYLVGVCLFQCVMALVIDGNGEVKRFVDTYIEQGQLFITDVDRLYGIGASLDVAGSRFAAVVMMVSFILANTSIKKSAWEYFIYITGIFAISILGNMIARTTIVGIGLGTMYFIFVTIRQAKGFENQYARLWKWFSALLVVSVITTTYLYETNTKFREDVRFGFEGFFNFFERGTFEYSSNTKLGAMSVWPTQLKTWLIGDGYFDSPDATNPYYTGSPHPGFYMGTDVGYQRFIFYFGIVGLAMFSFFLVMTTRVLMKRHPGWRMMFLMLLLVNFIVWTKVSTDIFLVFALFFCLPKADEDCVSDCRNV